MFGKNKVAMLVAEFLGTYALASAVLAMAGRTSFPYFGGAAAALTVAVMVLVVGPVSGAHLNPAVTFGLWSLRRVSSSVAVTYIVTQMLAGFVALTVNQYLLDRTFGNLAAKHWDARVLIAETLGTFIFTFGVAAAVYNKFEGGKLAAAIGGSLFVGVLVASFGSAGAVNPAVAIGNSTFSASYVVGPLVGAVLGMNLYDLLFAPAPAKPARKRK